MDDQEPEVSTPHTCEQVDHYHCERCSACIEEGKEGYIVTSEDAAGGGTIVCRMCRDDFGEMFADWLNAYDDSDGD